ncbi:TIM44-like domain-containing protein [Piscinibacter sp.]|uniref:TIM44-like domain-containing protein n=1 Tax=Piscinibacter sp. TaxID=1903157 RepID=UPI0039E41071
MLRAAAPAMLLSALAALPVMASAAALGVSVAALLLLRVRGRPLAAPRPLLARAVHGRAEHALLGAAREQFLRLQSAWDAADLDALRRLTTEDMFEQIAAELPGRGREPNRTEVLALEAHLIALDSVGPLELASIEFSGVVRESARAAPAPFREVWMLARGPGCQAAEGWLLARQQALM